MKHALVLTLAAGCAPRASVEECVPSALIRSHPTAVLHPVGQVWGLDPDLLQRAVADRLRAAGFTDVIALPRGASGAGLARLYVSVHAELLPRPLYDEDSFGPRRYHERVQAELRIHDRRGPLVYHAVWAEDLSSAFTEARAAETLLQPLD